MHGIACWPQAKTRDPAVRLALLSLAANYKALANYAAQRTAATKTQT